MEDFSVILMVILVFTWRCCAEVNSVERPENVTVSDLGLLGQLAIHWSRPASLQNVTNCAVRYQLEYFNTYKNEWRGYRTFRTTLRAQFDLERDVQVKLRTMLKGTCTNGTEHTSAIQNLVWSPPLPGVEGSRVRNFSCVFHRKQHMECTWNSGAKEPPHSKHFLYYWHNGLEAVAECPQYIQASGVRTGCMFPRETVKEFTDFNLCVNGSSPAGPLRPAYFSLQVQNHVKPGPVEGVSLEELQQGRELALRWRPAEDLVPPHCLEYEIMSEHKNQDGRHWRMVNITEDTSLVLPANQRSCARVRSRMSMYCSDSSFWSDWTHWKCLPEEDLSPAMSIALVSMLVGSAVALLSLCISLWMFCGTWRKKREQKMHCGLLWENQHLKLPQAFSHPSAELPQRY